jgi:formylglycine-generating enzyme required for sulfatase activity
VRTLMLVSVLLAVVLVRNESPLAAQDKKPADKSSELKFSDKKQEFAEVKVSEKPPALDCTGKTGADAVTAKAAQVAWAKYLGEKSHEKAFPLTKDGKVTVEMCLLPPGKYYRGDKYTLITIITISQPLWVSRYEVTQKQYEAVMGVNPSTFKQIGAAAVYPVETVSHNDCVNFTKKASEDTGAEFRLLREAEWEYAYRAGTRTKFYNGDSDENVGEIAQRIHESRSLSAKPGKVGSKMPNAFGIYDMAGNVWEWCSDWYAAYDETTTDPRGPQTGSYRVIRSLSHYDILYDYSAAKRNRFPSSRGHTILGFRLARVPSGLK